VTAVTIERNNMSTEFRLNEDVDQHEATKRKIRSEALKLLAQSGYHAVTLQNIAAGLDMELPTLADIYSSPVEILTETIQWTIEFGELLRKELGTLTDPRKKIEKYIHLHFAFLSANPDMRSLLLADMSISGPRRIHNKLRKLRNQRIALLHQILIEGEPRSLWISNDTEQMALLIIGFLRMTVTSWKESPSRVPLHVRGNAAVDFLAQILYARTNTQ
jgi:AcrR family transcriptional regulator